MKLEITLYDEDMIDFQTTFKKTLPLLKWQYCVSNIIFIPFWLSLIGYYNLFVYGRMVNFFDIQRNIFLYIVIIVFFIYTMSKFHQILENGSKQEIEYTKRCGRQLYLPNYTVEFLSDTLQVSSAKSIINYPYSLMESLLSDEKHLYFVFSYNEITILPFRCLHNQEQQLLNILKEKCPKQLKKHKKILLELIENKQEDNPYSPPKS